MDECVPVWFTHGAGAVACKAIGYVGRVPEASAVSGIECSRVHGCGGVAPRISNMACSGHEPGLLNCISPRR